LLREPRSMLVVLDRNTGEQVREISLGKHVSITTHSGDDPNGRAMQTKIQDLDQGVFPARYSMIAANGRLYFQCYATAWGKPVLGAPYCFACIDADASDATPPVRYLEVPTGTQLQPAKRNSPWTWRTKQTARAINSRGEEVTGDQRSQWDGWDWVFNGTPTRVNNRLYFTLATGLVYVLDVDKPAFAADAFVSLNDLGPIGQTWSA